MIKQTYYCDSCGSENQSEEYRQNPENFKQYSAAVTPISGGPMSTKSSTKQVCLSCLATVDAALAAALFEEFGE